MNAIRLFPQMQTLTNPLLQELIDHINVFEAEGAGKNGIAENRTEQAYPNLLRTWKIA